jgi:hypothetical protein
MQRFYTVIHDGTLATVADRIRVALELDPARKCGVQGVD